MIKNKVVKNYKTLIGKGLFVSLGFVLFPLQIPMLNLSVFAHEIEVSGDVAVTFHLEPNHNPQAGKPAQIWFALTRRGGQVIPLSQCNCQLAVYSQPRKPNDKPLMQPQLKSISAEKYQGIPGTEITFPKAGGYELELKGTAKGGGNFKPFQFKYTVIVR